MTVEQLLQQAANELLRNRRNDIEKLARNIEQTAMKAVVTGTLQKLTIPEKDRELLNYRLFADKNSIIFKPIASEQNVVIEIIKTAITDYFENHYCVDFKYIENGNVELHFHIAW